MFDTIIGFAGILFALGVVAYSVINGDTTPKCPATYVNDKEEN